MIYIWHHATALVLAAAAAAALSRARWTHRSPHLAVLLWHATALGTASGAVGLLLSIGLAPYQRGIISALGALAADLGAGVRPLSAGQLAAVAAGIALAAAAAGVQVHSSWRLRRQRSRHHLLLRLVGRPDPQGRGLVLDHPAAAAYYLPAPGSCVSSAR